MISSLTMTADGPMRGGWKLKAKLILDTCLADVFVVPTKERFVRPLGSLNRAKRSPGLHYTAVTSQSSVARN